MIQAESSILDNSNNNQLFSHLLFPPVYKTQYLITFSACEHDHQCREENHVCITGLCYSQEEKEEEGKTFCRHKSVIEIG